MPESGGAGSRPVDRRAFVDRPVNDVAAAENLAHIAAAEWGLGTPTLIRSGMNAIFAADSTVLRVGSPNTSATSAIDLARRLADEGLRVNRPVRDDVIEVGALSVTAWELIESTGAPIDWIEVGRMVRQVHRLDPSVLPADYPCPAPTDFPWWDFDALLVEVGDAIDDRARSGLVDAIHRWPDWKDMAGSVVCHGDVHPGNIIMSSAGPVLIDWDLLCRAPRGWDHGPMMTWTSRWGGEPGVYESLAEGYGTSLRDDPQAEAFAELRLVAATLMRVRAGLRNDAAMPEARRRLAYWRGERNAPMWRAQ